jgi:hypothetical protein
VTSRAAPTKVISNSLLAFGYRITLEQNGESLLVLGHERGLPASSASLIEKIGQSVLVLTRMTCELHHDSLVFFHRELDYEPVNNNRLEQGIPGQE